MPYAQGFDPLLIVAQIGSMQALWYLDYGFWVFLLNALSAGAPPHGGIALGMDRIVQRFTDSPSLRDTVAFPKTTAARALFEGAPTPSGRSALDELGLQLKAQDPSDRGEKEA